MIILKPLSLTSFISFNVMSLPRRAALRWHHLTIDPVTFNLPLVELSDAYFLRLISTFWSFQRPPLCPYNSLALFKLLCFCFILTSLCLKCFAWTNCIMLSLGSYRNSTSRNGIPVNSVLIVSIDFFCLCFCKNCVFSFKI